MKNGGSGRCWEIMDTGIGRQGPSAAGRIKGIAASALTQPSLLFDEMYRGVIERPLDPTRAVAEDLVSDGALYRAR